MAWDYQVLGTKTLTAAATQTLLQIAPPATSDWVAELIEVRVSFDNAAAAAGTAVELVRQSTAGTTAASAPSVVKRDPGAPATSVTVTWNHSAEPTLTEVVDSDYLTGGLAVIQFPLDQEVLMVGGGSRLAIRVTTPSAVTPSCKTKLAWKV